jgi:hypothetical protein
MKIDYDAILRNIESGKFNQAKKLCLTFLASYPTNTSVKKILSAVEVNLGDFKSCVSLLTSPDLKENLTAADFYNLGCAYAGLLEYELATKNFTQAIAINKQFFQAYHNRANIHRNFHRIDKALEDYATTLIIKPDHYDAMLNQAIAYFLIGNFEKAWPLYEYRLLSKEAQNKVRKRDGIQWKGQDIQGKTIYLYSEQGLGDSIQFMRYISLICQMKAQVVLEVQPGLIKMAQSNFPGIKIALPRTDIKDYDYHCPLPSLPLAFKTNIHNIPSSHSYLMPDADKLKAWNLRLGGKWLPRVGLVWSGNQNHNNDKNRSISLEQLMSFLPEGYDYISLQKDIRPEDLRIAQAKKLKLLGSELNDFSDTAALCQCMDLVISVDTSVAHLSGAIGKKTWVLLPFSPDWRWMLERQDSPWYQSMKLYRQTERGQWPIVLNQLAADMTKVVRVI